MAVTVAKAASVRSGWPLSRGVRFRIGDDRDTCKTGQGLIFADTE
jgi:hypothetical protein